MRMARKVAKISIHAPHEGSDIEDIQRLRTEGIFQSTLPTRGATPLAAVESMDIIISIHAPHEGSDGGRGQEAGRGLHFNPRSPRGGAKRKSAFVCSISANLLNIIHCGTVTRAVSRRRIALFRLFSVRRSGVFMYAYASH